MGNKERCMDCYEYFDNIENDDTIEECPDCQKMICYYCSDDHEMTHFDMEAYIAKL